MDDNETRASNTDTRLILQEIRFMNESNKRVENSVSELKTFVATEFVKRDEIIKELTVQQNVTAGKVSDIGGRFAIALTLLMALIAGIVGLFFSFVGKGV